MCRNNYMTCGPPHPRDLIASITVLHKHEGLGLVLILKGSCFFLKQLHHMGSSSSFVTGRPGHSSSFQRFRAYSRVTCSLRGLAFWFRDSLHLVAGSGYRLKIGLQLGACMVMLCSFRDSGSEFWGSRVTGFVFSGWVGFRFRDRLRRYQFRAFRLEASSRSWISALGFQS